jgi:hypothetical protein
MARALGSIQEPPVRLDLIAASMNPTPIAPSSTLAHSTDTGAARPCSRAFGAAGPLPDEHEARRLKPTPVSGMHGLAAGDNTARGKIDPTPMPM